MYCHQLAKRTNPHQVKHQKISVSFNSARENGGTDSVIRIYFQCLWPIRRKYLDLLMYCQKQTNRTNPKDYIHLECYSGFFLWIILDQNLSLDLGVATLVTMKKNTKRMAEGKSESHELGFKTIITSGQGEKHLFFRPIPDYYKPTMPCLVLPGAVKIQLMDVIPKQDLDKRSMAIIIVVVVRDSNPGRWLLMPWLRYKCGGSKSDLQTPIHKWQAQFI